jgi:hypothetical protein
MMADKSQEMRIAIELLAAYTRTDIEAQHPDPLGRFRAAQNLARIRHAESDEVLIASLLLLARELLDTIARQRLTEAGEPTAAELRKRGQQVLQEIARRYTQASDKQKGEPSNRFS